ncbi:MAG: hypothetical protein V4474_03585, partial [Patescibacteria group bacterium]
MQSTARKNENETALAAALKRALAEKKPTAQTKALKKAVIAAGTKSDDVQKPSREKRHYRRRKFDKKVSWGRTDFGTLTIDMSQFDIGVESELGGYMWTQIKRARHTPNQMQLDFTTELPGGIVLLHAQGGNVTDVTGSAVPSLPVVINWSAGNSEDADFVPHTRKKDADNIDFVFMRRSDGKFIQVQVSIVTRRGLFYIAVQEIWAGQVVRTTMDNAKTLETTVHTVRGADGREYGAIVAPLFDDVAYPGADYLKTFKNMGPKVVEYANVNGMTAP